MRERDLAVIDRDDSAAKPVVTSEALLRGQPLLVLAPHPDDESLGCGALLAQAFDGPGAQVVCLTDGSASHPASRTHAPDQLAALRKAELHAAVRCLGGRDRDVIWLGARDGALTSGLADIAVLADLARAGGIGLLLAPSPHDPHCDHEAGAEIGQQLKVHVPQIRLGYYPIWSRWHGRGVAPTPAGTLAVRFVPGDRAMRKKAAAIAAHRSQAGLVIRDAPDGFEMPPGFADFFARSDEVFFLADDRVAQ